MSSDLSTQEVLDNQDAVLGVLNTQMNFVKEKEGHISVVYPETGPESLQLSIIFLIFYNSILFFI